MKIFFALVVAALLAGCGTTGSVTHAIPKLNEPNFTLRDERPSDERKSRRDSNAVGTTTYYADDNLSPTPAELLERALSNASIADLKGKTVTLRTFHVYVIEPAVSLDGERFTSAVRTVPNPSPAGVFLAAPFIVGIESIRSQKLVSAVIRGSVDETEFVAQHTDRFRGRVSEENIRSVLAAALEVAAKSAAEAARR